MFNCESALEVGGRCRRRGERGVFVVVTCEYASTCKWFLGKLGRVLLKWYGKVLAGVNKLQSKMSCLCIAMVASVESSLAK